MSEIEEERESKKAYIRQNIDKCLQEKFVSFCQTQFETIDIDAWSFDYMQKLIAKFHKKLEQDNQDLKNPTQIVVITPPSTSPDNTIPRKYQRSESEESDPLTEQMKNKDNAEIHQPGEGQTGEGQTVDQIGIGNPEAKDSHSKFQNQSKQHENENRDLQRDNKMMQNSSAVELISYIHRNIDPTKKEQSMEQVQVKEKIRKFIPQNLHLSKILHSSESLLQDPHSKNMRTENQSPQNVLTEISHSKNRSAQISRVDQFEAFQQYGASLMNTKQQKISKKNPGIFSESTNIDAPKNTSPSSKVQSLTEFANAQRKKQIGKANSKIKITEVKQYNLSKTGNRVFKSDFQDTLSCIKSIFRPTHIRQITVKVISHQIVQKNILAPGYLMYNFIVEPQANIIQRNYEDFYKLRNALSKLYPGIQLPFLESKGLISATSKQYARRQGEMLQLFLSDILSNDELKNSRILEDFLTIVDHQMIKKKFLQYEKIGKIDSIEEMCLLQEQITICLTEDQRINKQLIGQMQYKVQYGLEKYRKLCLFLSSSFNQVISAQKSICDVLKELQDSVTEYNKRVSLKQIKYLEQAIKKVRDSHIENSERTLFEKQVVDFDILPFVYYEKENVRLSKQILDDCNALTNKFVKRSQNEKVNDQVPYLSKSLKEFKNGVLVESKNMLVLKYQAGFMQSRTSSELKRIFEHLGTKISDRWREIGEKFFIQFNSSINQWNQLVQ